jgi:hypothetical protein
VTLVSCGNDEDAEPLSESEYQRALTEIYAASGRADLLYNSLAYGKLPQSECARKARAFNDLVDELIGRVGALQAPARAEETQAEFVSGATAAADELDQVTDQVAGGEVTCGLQLQSRLSAISTARADRAVTRLRELGYIAFD